MISIIIPCHNAANWLPQTLESIKDQEHIQEVILVNDASTDDSVEIAKSFDQIPVQVISSSGRGVSAARNTGLSHARGEWIQFLDADDLLQPGKLARQLQIAIDSNAAVVYGTWQVYQEVEFLSFLPQQIVTPDYSGDTVARLLNADNFCQIGAALFNRQAVVDVGGFNVNMNCIEDVNLLLRLALSGFQFVKDTSEQIALLYRKFQSFVSLSTQNLQIFYDGCLLNTILVETAWKQQSQMLSEQRQRVLLEVYGNIARFYYEYNRPKFYEVLARIYNLAPNYLPSRPKLLHHTSKWVGYEHAEAIALTYRRLKRGLQAKK